MINPETEKKNQNSNSKLIFDNKSKQSAYEAMCNVGYASYLSKSIES